jgi:hypothetical protein
MRTTLLFSALMLLATAALADREVTQHFDSSLPARSIRRVLIDVPAGEIKVRNGAGDSIAVTGFARREYDDSDEREEYQRIVDDIRAEIFVNNDEAVVRRRFGPNAQSWGAAKFTSFDITVDVPKGVSIELATRVGEVKIDGTFGDIDVDLRAGEIEVRLPRASVRELSASCRIGEVHTDLGEQIVDREGVFPGRTHFFNAGGRSRVNVHTTVGEVRVVLTR